MYASVVQAMQSMRMRQIGDSPPLPSEADVASDFLPQTRLPTIDVELIRSERRDRHGRIGWYRFICGNVFGAQFQLALSAIARIRQAIHRQAKVRQNLVINDVVKKNGIRIEGFLRKDYAIVK